MYILLEGHRIKKDLEELLRIAFNPDTLTYIEDIKDYKEGRLLKSRVYQGDDGEVAETILYSQGEEIARASRLVDDIEVHIDSHKKKRNVAIKQTILELSNKEEYIPWGILTGIRPVKILHDLMDRGVATKEIERVLREEYGLLEEKLGLLLEVAKLQRDYLERSSGLYSIYVSIPFCPSRCAYCSFPSLNLNKNEDNIKSYIDALIYEIDEMGKKLDKEKLNTVYIGGGTPTSIPLEELRRVISKLREVFGENIGEFTVEAGRPDTLNYDYLKMLKDEGIERISINPQTMNDKTLELIGRDHNTEDLIEIYKVASQMGFESINMDLILGLPGESHRDIENTLRQIERLDPDNLTIHTLAIKTGSKFEGVIDSYGHIKDNEVRKLQKSMDQFITKNNYTPYYLYRQKRSIGGFENIGYSKEGKYCRYNISMMEERETVYGFGMGAVSKLVAEDGSVERIPNFKGLKDYIDRVDELIERKLV